MSFIRVAAEDLRTAASQYAEAAARLDQLIRALGEATSLAAGAEGDFQEQVRNIEVTAVSLAQHLLNDVAYARDYLVGRADAFEQADHALDAGLDQLAREIKAAADLGGSFTLVPPWLFSRGSPPGHEPAYWDRLALEDKLAIQEDIQRRLKRWLEQLTAEGRLATATIEEFEDLLRGVRKVWAWTDLNVRTSAGAESPQIGSLSTYQVAEWTGQVAMVAGSPWYEVIYQDKEKGVVRGWVSAKYVEEYAYVRPELDPNVEGSKHPFDLSRPAAYVPSDEEVGHAIETGAPPQNLDLSKYFGEKQLTLRVDRTAGQHLNLCGAFAVAGATGHDVKDVLSTWLEENPGRATEVLEHDAQAWRSDLEDMLDGFGIAHERQDGWMSPAAIRERIQDGRQMIVLVGASSSTGALNPSGVGHWAVLEQVMPAGNDGWVRLSNSLIRQDRGAFAQDGVLRIEAVVRYSDFVSAWRDPGIGNPGTDYVGIWVGESASPTEPPP